MSKRNGAVAEVVNLPTVAEIDASITRAKASLASFAAEILWQVENRVWVVKGYPDWDTYREAVYGGAAVILPRTDRRELVAGLRALNLTQQQIADTAGVDQKTVSRDLNRHLPNENSPPAFMETKRGRRPAAYKRRAPRPKTERKPKRAKPTAPPAITKDQAVAALRGQHKKIPGLTIAAFISDEMNLSDDPEHRQQTAAWLADAITARWGTWTAFDKDRKAGQAKAAEDHRRLNHEILGRFGRTK